MPAQETFSNIVYADLGEDMIKHVNPAEDRAVPSITCRVRPLDNVQTVRCLLTKPVNDTPSGDAK